MEITKVFISKYFLFTSELQFSGTTERLVFTNCKFHQTSYGSIVIFKPTGSIIEYYPSQISHVIFKK